MSRHTVYISVGSNLGDALANCRFGIEETIAHQDVRLTGTSFFYRTAPVGFTEQNWFVNAAFRIETAREAHELLALTNAVQASAGQGAKSRRFGPRILDLDLIFFDDRILNQTDLELPHPRMHKRRFVLQPICDIDPQFVHPVMGRSVQDLLTSLEDDEQEVVRIDV